MFSLLKLPSKTKECLLIHSKFPWSKIKIFDDITIIFQGKDNSYCIGEDDVLGGLQSFIFGLTKSVEKKRIILESSCICRGNIGLQMVKEFVEIIVNDNANADENKLCLHQKYKIFGYKNKRVSWLYNDHYENIILEITPWFDVRKHKNKALYKKWIENYKPILKRTITPEIAQQWIQQMQMLLRTVRANSGIDSEYNFINDKSKL